MDWCSREKLQMAQDLFLIKQENEKEFIQQAYNDRAALFNQTVWCLLYEPSSTK